MRSGLFWKMFLLQLLAATAVLAGALAVSRAYSVRSFADYVSAREHARVHEVALEVGMAYRQSHDLAAAFEWVGVLHDHWRPMPGPPGQPGPGPHRHQIPIPPLQLLDAQGTFVAGDDHHGGDHHGDEHHDDDRPGDEARGGEQLREPITADGQLVGYLAWSQIPPPEQMEFAHRQAGHLMVIAPVALGVAAVFALLITVLIVRPIRALSAGADALARRQFTTRLPEHRRDELGGLAADFNRLAEALEAYDSRQKQWLADIAHELRTPLSVLRGEIDALLEGVRTFGPNTVQSLSEETRRLEALIRDLDLVAQAESGALRLELVSADVGELVKQAGARFAKRFDEAGFEMKVAAEPGLVANVDTQRFEQVLANLLQNVLKHATPGLVTIGARADGAGIAVSVADSGPGVPAETLGRLFDRLYRVDSARTRATGGAGLGLSICKSIVEAHAGTVAATRSAAGGLEIAIRLPREKGSPLSRG